MAVARTTKTPVKREKLYYSITEVGEMTGLKPHILRYWESEFPFLRPKRNRAGNRIYRKKDIELIMLIKKLLYEEGYTIEGAKHKIRKMKYSKTKKTESVDYKEFLREVRDELMEIRKLI